MSSEMTDNSAPPGSQTNQRGLPLSAVGAPASSVIPITRGLGRFRLRESEDKEEQKILWEKVEPFLDENETSGIPRQCLRLEDDEVQNNAGGYVYTVSDKIRVRRFLILGTTGGTYYAKEQELKLENVKDLTAMIDKGKAMDILKEIHEVNRSNRAPKMSPLIYCLALVTKYTGPLETDPQKKLRKDVLYRAYELFPRVCRIPTHLFEFVADCENIGKGKSTGWGRAHRTNVSNWYMRKNVMPLAQAVTKFQRRKEWSHRDVLRLAHPSIKKKMDPNHHLHQQQQPQEYKTEHNDIFLYCTKGFDALIERHPTFWEQNSAPVIANGDAVETKPPPRKRLIEGAPKHLVYLQAVEDLKICKDENEAVELIKNFDLVREHTPSNLLNSVPVWRALLENMPLTAMIRNLGKMTAIGLITEQDNEESKKIVRKLNDIEALKAARVHPLNILMALAVYRTGKGDKGKLKWKPNKSIEGALDDAFYAAFCNVHPTNRRFLLALDVSGSMDCSMSGSALTCREASAAMATLAVRTEPCCEVVAFQEELTKLELKKEDNLGDVLAKTHDLPFGGTDCSLPMLWAAQNRKKFDCFIVYTDSETWCGDVKPAEALKLYRQKSGVVDAKLIVVAMTASKFTIADPKDTNMMDVVGFDTATPELIRNFVASGFETSESEAGGDDWSFLENENN